jgi:hypothetical protein
MDFCVLPAGLPWARIDELGKILSRLARARAVAGLPAVPVRFGRDAAKLKKPHEK